jgi:hypothetical protein
MYFRNNRVRRGDKYFLVSKNIERDFTESDVNPTLLDIQKKDLRVTFKPCL